MPSIVVRVETFFPLEARSGEELAATVGPLLVSGGHVDSLQLAAVIRTDAGKPRETWSYGWTPIALPRECVHVPILETIACPSCDLLQVVPELTPGARARCPRCHRLVSSRAVHPLQRSLETSLALAITTVVVFAVAAGTPLIRMYGREPSTTLVSTAQEIWLHHQEVTAAVLALFTLAVPAGYAAAIVVVLVEVRRAPAPHWVAIVLRAADRLRPWLMVDVMMLAIFIALTKLTEMAPVLPGVGLYATGALVGFLAMTMTTLDRRDAWSRIRWVSGHEPPPAASAAPSVIAPAPGRALSAVQAGLVSCTACQLLSRAAAAAPPGHCPRCGARLDWRRRNAVQKTWAFIIGAAGCYLPANILPVLISHSPRSSEAVTVLGGVVFLYHSGSWLLALVVLVASVMIPLAKLTALAYLLTTIQSGDLRHQRDRTRLYRLVDVIGKWSMLDVFVDSLMVAVAQLPPFLSIEPGMGIPFFMAVVVLTLAAARSFDTRLIWDSGFAHG